MSEFEDIQNTEEDNEFLEDFILEATEHIENIEMNVLILEKKPDCEETINTMFRSFHTIKGLAGFVEQSLIEQIAHQTETLMDGCRKKTIKANKAIVDSILISSDYIKKICEDISITKDENFLTSVKNHLEKVAVIEQEAKQNPKENNSEPIPKLGELLVEDKMLTEEEVKQIVDKQKKEYPDLKFGEVAIQEEKVKPKDVLNAIRTQQTKTSVSEEYMRISAEKVDSLVDMVGELVITQSLIEQTAIEQLEEDTVFVKNFNRMTRITKDLQNLAMYLRMVPLKSTFQKISRIARDTINELEKDIDFSTSGDDTEIDRMVTERLLEPLVHLVKNAISHGIETKGIVTVDAYNKRGSIYIEISDNGKGIDTEKVYQKALEKGLIDPNKEYSEAEIQEFIMLPGFSTMEVANNISGRGVGMDVVKTEISKIGGKIEIQSKKGKGSTFTLKIPVNHAIMNGTIVDIEGSKYIIPTLNVKQIVQPKPEDWVYICNTRSRIKVRGDVIPVISIANLFNTESDEEPVLVVILELDQKFMALPVRNVIDRREIVIKPAGEEFASLDFISGMSILGDGKVSLILDIDNVFKKERS